MAEMAKRKVPAKVLHEGRVTVPKDVRRDLNLSRGDYVLLDVEPLEGSE